MKNQISYKINKQKEQQIKKLQDKFGCNRTEIIDLAIDVLEFESNFVTKIFNYGEAKGFRKGKEERISAQNQDIRALILGTLKQDNYNKGIQHT